MDVVLSERVAVERKKIAVALEEEEKKKAAEQAEEAEAADGDDEPHDSEDAPLDKKDDVEIVTRKIEKLTTAVTTKLTPPAVKPVLDQPVIRIRILSVTPVKHSKRRGDIGGKVTLAMYPPDPCLLFKQACRDAGKIAAEVHFERQVVQEDIKEEVESFDAEKANNGIDKVEKEEVVPSEDAAAVIKPDDPKPHVDNDAQAKETTSIGMATKPKQPAVAPRAPQIPYYPLLSPAERSRAVARSRVLLSRTIEAFKIHVAATLNNNLASQWEIMESSSQKTWKGRPHPMVASLMSDNTKPLGGLVAEHDATKSNVTAAGGGAVPKKSGRGRGYDSRSDRYDSTVENSEDYKAFMESLLDGGRVKDTADGSGKDAKKTAEKSTVVAEEALDEEGRPISAIVKFFREKHAVANKAKVEAAAAASKARAAASAAAKEKARKDKLQVKKEASKRKKKDAVRAKQKRSERDRSDRPSARPVSGSGRGGGKGGNSSLMPPPGAMLLKKRSGVP